jgi:predicted AAA+ superfamily ATPase
VISLVAPLHANVTTRLSKSPKLYFLDSGLMCFLLGIRDPRTLITHMSRGPVFETWVASEIVKLGFNDARRPSLGFLRDKRGREIDLTIERGRDLVLIEVKSGRTFARDWAAPMRQWREDLEKGGDSRASLTVIYGGDESTMREGIRLMSWRDLVTGTIGPD